MIEPSSYGIVMTGDYNTLFNMIQRVSISIFAIILLPLPLVMALTFDNSKTNEKSRKSSWELFMMSDSKDDQS